MRVLVTGATGFVGAWTARAVADAGHEVRLLVRDPSRLAGSAEAIGVDTGDRVVADIADRAAVRAALQGCDAVIHCAAVVATDRRRAAEVLEVNLAGARNVLGGALDAGLDPVVHVSSITALFDPEVRVLHADLPVAGGTDAYGRSKAAVDQYVRDLQDRGEPVVVTYPGMVLGPPAGRRFGEAADGIEQLLRLRLVPGRHGAFLVVDVRDLALLHARTLVAGRGPRRFMAGGHYLDPSRLGRLMTQASGRPVRVAPVPGRVLRGVGRLVDQVTRVAPFDTVLTGPAMEYYTHMPASDDRPSEAELGISYRDPLETLIATVDGLVAVGRVPAHTVRR